MPNIFNNDTSLSKRLRNINNLDITENVIVSINEFDTAQSIPISSTGQQILNSVSLDELKTLLLEGVQEAVIFSNTDGQREINFHIKTADEDPIDASNLRLSIREDELRIYDDIIPQVGSKDLGSATNQFGSFYGSTVKIGRIYSKEPNATIYLDLTDATKLLTYKHFEPQTADLNIGASNNPFNNIYLSNSIIANGAVPINFNAQKYIFYTQGALNKKLEINNTNCDFTSCNLRVLGNNNTLTIGSTNGTEHLKFGYIPTGGGLTSIDSLSVPLHITTGTGSNQNINITPDGTGRTYIDSHLDVDGFLGASHVHVGMANITSFGKLSVRTTDTATYTGNAEWTDEYVVIGEAHRSYIINGVTKYGLCVGIGINRALDYAVIKCLEPNNIWRALYISAGSIELTHQGTVRMTIVDNIIAKTHIIPGNHNTHDIGADTNPTGAGTENWFRNAFFSNVYAGNVLLTSDRTLKQDIVDLEYGLDYIKKLKPKQYKYISNKNGRLHWGLIAQDVREVNDNDMYSSWGLRPNGKQQLNYTEFIAPLIKAVQQLDTKINQISHTAGHQVDSVKRNISMSVVELDDFKQMEDLKEKTTNSQIRIDTLKMRVDKMEGIMSDKMNAPTEKQIDEARLDILEARVKELETKEHKCSGKDANNSDDESDGNMNVLDLIQQRLHELEKRNTKLEAKVKKQTTIINKLVKKD